MMARKGCYADDLKRTTHKKKKKQPILKLREKQRVTKLYTTTHMVNIWSTELHLVFQEKLKKKKFSQTTQILLAQNKHFFLISFIIKKSSFSSNFTRILVRGT